VKKIFLFVLLLMFIATPVFASMSVDIEVNQTQVTLSGTSSYKNMPVSIRIFDDYRSYYIDQGLTDENGDFEFNFMLDENKEYSGKVNVNGEAKVFEVSTNGNDVILPIIIKDTAYISIKGYNGQTVLSKTKVEVEEGDTVLDILKRVLEQNDIDFETRGGYVKSIDGLSEFDHGAKSGWMFKINGEFPDIGMDDVEVGKDDNIVILYTTDLGADVGNVYYVEQTGLERALEEADEIFNDEDATEEEIKNAIDSLIDNFSKDSEDIQKEADAKKVVSNAVEVIQLIDKVKDKIYTEEGAEKIAEAGAEILQALKKSAGKITEVKTREKVKDVTVKAINTVLNVVDKIQEQKEVDGLVDSIMDSAVKIAKELEKEHAKEIHNNVVKLIQKAIEKLGTERLSQHQIDKTGDKIVAQVEVDKLFEKAELAVEKAKEMENKLAENNIELNRSLEKKIVIEVPSGNADGVEINLPSGAIGSMLSKNIDKAVIKTEIAVFHVTAKTFGDKARDKKINFKANKVKLTEIPDDAKLKIPENSIVIDLDVALDNEAISYFEEPIEVSIPYTGEVEDSEKITVFLLKDDGTVEAVGGEYDAVTKTAKFMTNHFSKYFAKISVKEFTDLNDNYDWAKKSIEVMAGKGFINGKAEGIFAPEASITRAEFAAIVTRMLKYEASDSIAIPFEDVHKSSWYYKAVAAAYQNGLVNGKSSKTFDPDGKITRQEVATIIAKVLKSKSFKQAGQKELDLFQDKENIAEWAKSSVALSAKLEIVKGTDDGTFAPNKGASRAQASVMLYRLYKLLMN